MSSASKKLLKELPTEEEMRESIMRLIRQPDHVTALAGAAYLDHALEILLRAHFRPLTKMEQKRMFDGSANAILGTSSAKIRLSYAIQLIDPLIYRDLLIVNDIRNVFAHSLHAVSFDHPLIAEDCQKLMPLSEFSEAKIRFSFTVIADFISLRKSVNRLVLASALRNGDTSPSPNKSL